MSRFHRSELIALVGALALSGCRQDMHDQPKYKAGGASAFFADGRNDRPLVKDTVARGRLNEDDHLYRGKVDGKAAETYPFEITAAILQRGRERYAIYCTPCHSPQGDGNGIVVQRGMKRPPSYHIERLQKSPPGYFFDVLTNGFGAMYDYSDRIDVNDRWAIVAYVQTLQASQNTKASDLTADERAKLSAAATKTNATGAQGTAEHK
ncbi:MAG: cytochrome c [Planctomycetota bacterium]|nr:cytochrome c [Planctomycetota bacterium]